MSNVLTKLRVEQKVVVVFDMCSSSNIIEELTLTDNLSALRSLLINLKRYIETEAKDIGFEPYKFTGDGWILLFSDKVEGKILIRFINQLSKYFKKLFIEKIETILERNLARIGLTFGIEKGPLFRLKMFQQTEYVGRALNIACRLQSAIKDNDPNPGYKILLSNQVYQKYFKEIKDLKFVKVTRILRNIQGGSKYQCVKVRLNVS